MNQILVSFWQCIERAGAPEDSKVLDTRLGDRGHHGDGPRCDAANHELILRERKSSQFGTVRRSTTWTHS